MRLINVPANDKYAEFFGIYLEEFNADCATEKLLILRYDMTIYAKNFCNAIVMGNNFWFNTEEDRLVFILRWSGEELNK